MLYYERSFGVPDTPLGTTHVFWTTLRSVSSFAKSEVATSSCTGFCSTTLPHVKPRQCSMRRQSVDKQVRQHLSPRPTYHPSQRYWQFFLISPPQRFLLLLPHLSLKHHALCPAG